MPRTPKPDYNTEPRKPLPGSARPAIAAAVPRSKSTSRKRISVSVLVHCTKPIPASAIAGRHLTRAQFRSAHSSDASAVKAVKDFARCFHLTATSEPLRRTVTLTGTVANMEKPSASASTNTPRAPPPSARAPARSTFPHRSYRTSSPSSASTTARRQSRTFA